MATFNIQKNCSKRSSVHQSRPTFNPHRPKKKPLLASPDRAVTPRVKQCPKTYPGEDIRTDVLTPLLYPKAQLSGPPDTETRWSPGISPRSEVWNKRPGALPGHTPLPPSSGSHGPSLSGTTPTTWPSSTNAMHTALPHSHRQGLILGHRARPGSAGKTPACGCPPREQPRHPT